MKKILITALILAIFCNGHSQKIKIAEPVRFLALGDSYTIGQSVAVSERWPVQLEMALVYQGINVQETRIIAQTGWRTDNLKNAVNSQQPLTGYNLVSLLIGVNNQYQGGSLDTYAIEFEELLNTAISLAGGIKDHVFVLSIPDYAYTPFGNGSAYISDQIDLFNTVNRQITENYGVSYIDITPISRNGLIRPELVASDGLHPSGIMYGLWVDEIMKLVEKELGLFEQAAELVRFSTDYRKLTISSLDSGADLHIFNVSGNLVKRIRVYGHQDTHIDLSGLPAGMYFIRLQTGLKVLFNSKIAIF